MLKGHLHWLDTEIWWFPIICMSIELTIFDYLNQWGMEIILKRASFNAEDFNCEANCRQFASAKNLGGFVSIEIADQSVDAFKETLRATYADLDYEYERKVFKENPDFALERRQMMISQIITKMFKP